MPRGNKYASQRQHTKDVMCIDMVEAVFGIARRTIFNKLADDELSSVRISGATFITLKSLRAYIGADTYDATIKNRAVYNSQSMLWEFTGETES